MPKYDIENLLNDIKVILVANLNAAITAVEAEKVAQGLPASNIQLIDTTNGYIEQSISDGSLNLPQMIFYGVEDIKTIGVGPATAQTYHCFVVVMLTDIGLDTLNKRRIHRYTRAIKDVMENNYDKIPSSSRIKIETIAPVSFKLDLNSSEEVKVGGVSIVTALA